MIGFAPAAPSSSTLAFSWRARSAFSVASTGCCFAAFSTSPSRSSVTPFIAETTTAKLLPRRWPPMMPATRRMQLASATLVPPNLWTVQVMTRFSGEAVFGGREHSRTAAGYEWRAARAAAIPRSRPRAAWPRSSRRSRSRRRSPTPRRTCRRRPPRSGAMFATLTPPSTSSRDRQARAVDESSDRRDLRQHRFDELLPAEARVHGHQQHEVDFVEHVLEPVERRRRIEHEAALAAALANQLQRAIDVLASLRDGS